MPVCLSKRRWLLKQTNESRVDHEFSSVVLGHHTPWRIEGQKSGPGVLWMREAKDWNLWDGLGEAYPALGDERLLNILNL